MMKKVYYVVFNYLSDGRNRIDGVEMELNEPVSHLGQIHALNRIISNHLKLARPRETISGVCVTHWEWLRDETACAAPAAEAVKKLIGN